MAAGGGRATKIAASVFGAAYPIVAFWLFAAFVTLIDREQAPERLAMIVAGVVGLYLLRIRVPTTKVLLVALAVAAGSLGLLRAWQAYEAVDQRREPHIDIATTTIASVELQREGRNPYTEVVDHIGLQVDPTGTGFHYFGGFKYGPAMTWIYTPGVLARGPSGFYITNFALLMIAAGAAAWWVSTRGISATLGAAALVLVPGFLQDELFAAGSNDIAAIATALVAFAFRSHGLGVAAGIALGVSFGMKPMPALVLTVPLLLSGATRMRVALAAGLTALACYLPALIRSPKELIAGLITFNARRPPDETSLLDGAPDLVVMAAVALSLAAAVGLAWWWDRRRARWEPGSTALVASAAVAVAFLGSRQVHRNYMVWLLPLMAVALAGRVWAEPTNSAAEPALGD
ncbi:MAG TPA: hypothetical protein VJ927_02840 [Actinomycetota bacterium]|nr:hypothetical protein [Actinomycetota bacterium]